MGQEPHTYSPARLRTLGATVALALTILPTTSVALSLSRLFGLLTRAEAVVTDAEADLILADVERLDVELRGVAYRQLTAVSSRRSRGSSGSTG
jgi:hypothetical protein